MEKTKTSEKKESVAKILAGKKAKTVKNEPKVESNNEKPLIVGAGHLVSVDYTGSLDNGEEFDSSKNNGPISFVVGSGHVIKGFDNAVLGMKVGQSKNFKINKKDAYGDINPQLMHKVSMDKLPEEIRKQVKEGGFLVLQSPIGQQIPAKVNSIKNNEITLDLNHPLAGKDLTFEITIRDISIPSSIPSEKDIHHGHDHGGHDHSGHDHGGHDYPYGECGCGDDCDCGDDSDDCCGGSCNCK